MAGLQPTICRNVISNEVKYSDIPVADYIIAQDMAIIIIF